MKRFAISLALTCVLSFSAMAGEMPTCGITGNIPTVGITETPDTDSMLAALLNILSAL